MARAGQTLAAAIVLLSAAPGAADEPTCDLCIDHATDQQSLRIEIDSGLQFSRLALRGKEDGEAAIDPQTGQKHVDANMIDLGGPSYQGHARITGAPLKPIRIELPSRVVLHSPDGAQAELTDFVTDLPPVAMLDEHGTLTFSFGARIASLQARAGNFRGRIPIRVDYY